MPDETKHRKAHAADSAADHTGQGDIVTHNAAEFEAAGASLLLAGGTMTGRYARLFPRY